MTRTAWPAPPIDLNRLTAHWRVALGAAHDALTANARCPGGTHLDDVRVREGRLNQERDVVAKLLDADARMEHVRLVRSLALPSATRDDLGLAADTLACLFDLDGVLAPSADLHFAAWADTLDTFLAKRMEGASVHFSHYARFSRRTDYAELHGKPRLDGIRAFLASRGITLPEGSPDDPPGTETVWGLANGKHEALEHRLAAQGVSAFADSYRYLQAVVDAGVTPAVVSPSEHTEEILVRAGLADLVRLVIDGNVMRARGLEPQPAPDTLLAACEQLAILPRHAAAFQTTPAGIEAARTAGVGLVIGVVRSEGPGGVVAGADVIVGDLADLLHPRLTR